MSTSNEQEYQRFEDIKHVREGGTEYWLARELALVLDYTQWRNFTKVIDKAMIACHPSFSMRPLPFTLWLWLWLW